LINIITEISPFNTTIKHMANIIRIKRRGSGAAGAPVSLKNAELAFNEVDNTLYYGRGVDPNGNATEVIPIGGNGYVTTLVSGVSSVLNASITALRSDVVTASGTLYGAITTEADARTNAITSLRSDVATASSVLNSAITAEVNARTNAITSLRSDVATASSVLNSAITALRNDLSTVSGDLLDTINDNLSTVLGADISELAPQLNSIKELAASLSGDADFFTTVNSKLTALSSAIGGEGGSSSRLGVLETAFQTLTGTSLVSVLGNIASQNKESVDITGGSISGVTLTATGTAEFNSINATGSLTVGSGLTVTSGTANLSGALSVVGATNLGSTLTVQGATTIVNSLSVTENVTLDKELSVSGATTISNSLSVTGNVNFDGTLTSTGGTATFGHVNLTSMSGASAHDFTLFNCVLDSGTF
jgi:hypothetical protein